MDIDVQSLFTYEPFYLIYAEAVAVVTATEAFVINGGPMHVISKNK